MDRRKFLCGSISMLVLPKLCFGKTSTLPIAEFADSDNVIPYGIYQGRHVHLINGEILGKWSEWKTQNTPFLNQTYVKIIRQYRSRSGWAIVKKEDGFAYFIQKGNSIEYHWCYGELQIKQKEQRYSNGYQETLIKVLNTDRAVLELKDTNCVTSFYAPILLNVSSYVTPKVTVQAVQWK